MKKSYAFTSTYQTWLPKVIMLACMLFSLNTDVKAQTCLPPSALTSSNIGNNTATISWTAPNPAPSLGYVYYINTTGVPPTASTSVSTLTVLPQASAATEGATAGPN